jgi:hypothetical protein
VFGEKNTKYEKKSNPTTRPRVSFIKKYGKKLILSDADEIPRGLFEPSWCTTAI